MRISDWSSDVCSSDLTLATRSTAGVDDTGIIPPLCSEEKSEAVSIVPFAACSCGGLLSSARSSSTASASPFAAGYYPHCLSGLRCSSISQSWAAHYFLVVQSRGACSALPEKPLQSDIGDRKRPPFLRPQSPFSWSISEER